MHDRSRWLSGLVALVLGCGLLLVAVPAHAVGTGNPAIVAPSPGAKHYVGYTGPFEVSFEDAPIADYDWFVEKVPSGGGAPVKVTATHTYAWTGSGANPQLRTSALPAGTGYQFRVTDNAGHEAVLGFAVLPGPAPACSILVPAQVRVNAPVERITGRLARGCAALHTDWAAWKVQHVTHGFADLFYFDGSATDVWSYFDDEPTGTYAITPNGARSTALEDVPQNTRRTVVRRDSRLAVAAKRSGSTVTLTASLRRYLPKVNGFRPWTARTVVVSYRTCARCSWHHLRTKRTDRHGVLSVRASAPRARQYRVTASGTTTVWSPAPRFLRR